MKDEKQTRFKKALEERQDAPLIGLPHFWKVETRTAKMPGELRSKFKRLHNAGSADRHADRNETQSLLRLQAKPSEVSLPTALNGWLRSETSW